MKTIQVRRAIESDVRAINALYNTFVKDTAVTFDVQPTTDAERMVWFSKFADTGPHQIFVAEAEGIFLGYAGSMLFRVKEAYKTSVETTIYVDPEAQTGGVGTKLYQTLFDALAKEDVHRAYAGISLPNAPSIALHEKQGFTLIGTYNEVGFKLGKYWDVAWYERRIS